MEAFAARYRTLCTPAKVFAVLQLIGIAGSVAQQASKASIGGVLAALIGGGAVMYILTWLLNLLCRHGMRWLAWVLAVGPIVLFVILGGLAGVMAYFDSKKKPRHRGKK